MKKIAKLFMITLVFCSMMTVCITAYASSYYKTTLYFQGEYKGATRTFDGQHISYSATTYTNYPNSAAHTYRVELWRSGLFGGTKIGSSETFERDAYNWCEWTNVGSGKYYLYFIKARDGIHVYSDDVVIQSYN